MSALKTVVQKWKDMNAILRLLIGFIIRVIQDSVETALNSSGDVVFSATAEHYVRRKKGEDMRFLGEYAKKKKGAPAEG